MRVTVCALFVLASGFFLTLGAARANAAGCACAYYDMGPYWYGEVYEECNMVGEGCECLNPQPQPIYSPIGAPHNCVNCNCEAVVFAAEKEDSQPLKPEPEKQDTSDPCLSKKKDPGQVLSPLPNHVKKIKRHFYKITKVDGAAPAREVFVIVWDIQLEKGHSPNKEEEFKFRVGFECHEPSEALQIEHGRVKPIAVRVYIGRDDGPHECAVLHDHGKKKTAVIALTKSLTSP